MGADPRRRTHAAPRRTRRLTAGLNPWVERRINPNTNLQADVQSELAEHAAHMNTTGYIINAALVLLVISQIRERKLSGPHFLLPLLCVGISAYEFLHTIPSAGNDLTLIGACIAGGAALGGLCALTTHLRADEHGNTLSRAGLAAATLWIVGVGGRLAFAYASEHGAGPAITRFSIHNSITGADAWTAALVTMALAEVLMRTGVLYARSRSLSASYRAHTCSPQTSATRTHLTANA